jgi:hypothetical protein
MPFLIFFTQPKKNFEKKYIYIIFKKVNKNNQKYINKFCTPTHTHTHTHTHNYLGGGGEKKKPITPPQHHIHTTHTPAQTQKKRKTKAHKLGTNKKKHTSPANKKLVSFFPFKKICSRQGLFTGKGSKSNYRAITNFLMGQETRDDEIDREREN